MDISFDTGVRSLAGLDSIAQMAGRINRHGKYACKPVFIIRSADENLDKLPDIQGPALLSWGRAPSDRSP